MPKFLRSNHGLQQIPNNFSNLMQAQNITNREHLVAIQAGGTSTNIKVFKPVVKFMDNLIHLETVKSIKGKTQDLSRLTREAIQAAKQLNRNQGQDLSVPVTVSWAGDVQHRNQNSFVKLTNMQTDNDDLLKQHSDKDAYLNLNKYLKAIDPRATLKEAHNDGVALAKATQLDFKLKPETKVEISINGTGQGTIPMNIDESGRAEIRTYQNPHLAWEAGHNIAPGIEKYKNVEGDRSASISPTKDNHSRIELYGSGSNKRQGGLEKILDTVLAKLKSVKNTNQEIEEKGIQAILDTLNETMAENDLDSKLKASDILSSSLIAESQSQKLSNENIIDHAKQGDKFAQTLVNFALIRMGNMIAATIVPQDDKDEAISLIPLHGGYAKALMETANDSQRVLYNIIDKDLKLNHHKGFDPEVPMEQAIQIYNPDLGGLSSILTAQTRKQETQTA